MLKLRKCLLSILAVVLCLILVFNAGIVQCFAVAGVDDALFWLLVAVLASSGITFASVADAHTGCDALWNNFDTSTQDFLLRKVDTILGASGIASTTTIGINFLIDQWTNIIQGITSTFGDYTGTDAVINIGRSGILTIDDPLISFNITYNPGSYIIYNISGNSSISIIGASSDGTVPSYLNMDMSASNYVCQYFNIANVFTAAQRYSVSQVVANQYNIGLMISNNTYTDIGFHGMPSLTRFKYFLGQPLTINLLSDGKFTMTTDGINIVQNGYLRNTSIPVPGSICPDGIWNSRKDYTDWLNDLIFGNSDAAALGNPGIDAVAYPGNDVWHDGSINDDVDVGSPSIGISVPTDLNDDIIGVLTPDVARDYENTDVKEKDIVTTETDVNPDEQTNTPTKDKPAKVFPALSLPEVLFKEKFPFCLPWDLYNLFVGMSETAEAPRFTIPYKNEMLGIEENYTLDLSRFDDAAKVIRFFVGAGFVMALILISRKLTGSE